VKRFRKATKSDAPTIAQMIGKGCEPNLITQKRGRSSFSAINVPIKAPTNPRTIEAKHPILDLPARLAPTNPAIEAIRSINKKEKRLISHSLFVSLKKVF